MLQVSGYVKAVSSAGVFVVLARNVEARVKMGHLSDSYVKDPKEAFPEGKLVEGRIISAADGRCGPWTITSLTPQLPASASHSCDMISTAVSLTWLIE